MADILSQEEIDALLQAVDDDEDGAFYQGSCHVVHRCLDEVGLTEDLGVHRHIGGKGLLNILKVAFDVLCDFQGVDVGLFGY